MSEVTSARVAAVESAHWYSKAGEACHTVKAKAGHDRPTTIADARKLSLLPSPTSLLGILDKPALTSWKIEQAVLAALTAPRQDGEQLDAFVKRVLQTERQQDDVSKAAMDLGTACHAALEDYLLTGKLPTDQQIATMCNPVMEWLKGKFPKAIEMTLVGDGYAGKVDAIVLDGNRVMVVDFKTTTKLPRESYLEHKLQLSAYAAAYETLSDYSASDISTVNIYISKTEPGTIKVCENLDWTKSYKTFMKLLDLWCDVKDYDPRKADMSINDKLDAAGL